MSAPELEASSTNLDPKSAGLLCYLLTFISGIIFLIIEKNSRFVKFHALQSIITFGGLTVLNFIFSSNPFTGWISSIIITPFHFILWIIMMVMARRGKWYKLPFIGDFVERQIDRFK